MKRRSQVVALVFLVVIATVTPLAAQDAVPKAIEFNRDIRPILSDNCFQCHGPDKGQRKADLRLDVEKEVFADRGGYQVLTPKNPDKSELWHRITTDEKAEQMPPPKSGKTLSKQQLALIRQWIEQGAPWQNHWSLIPAKRPVPPKVKNAAWVRNPIDAFVLARLEREGLTPSPEADRATLIRRVTLDLTGLPPTLEEVEAFVNDKSPDAYEKVVDRLLNSPRYGERMALPWLDAARYADTNGYQADAERHMWRWRDWVIAAFNKNMPFDQFTVDQIAGDLLPNATVDQKIATGFNRNHRGNAEGGIIPEEYLVEYAVDRVDTTTTVWLGLTAGCARCHDHKYDPISQKEFYQLVAYFNNIPERGKVVRFGNSPPFIKAPTPEQEQELARLQGKIKKAKTRSLGLEEELQKAQQAWEKTVRAEPPILWTLDEGLHDAFLLDNDAANGVGKNKPGSFEDGKAEFVPGKIGQALRFDGKCFVNAPDAGKFGFYDKFSLAAWIFPTGDQGGTILSRMEDTERSQGYSLVLDRGAVQLNLVVRWLDDAVRVETKKHLQAGQWYHVVATYEGSRSAKGIRIYINGEPQELKINLDDLNQDFATKFPFKIGAGGDPGSRFHGLIDDVRLYQQRFSPEEAAIVATTDSITHIALLPADKRSRPQKNKLQKYFLEQQAPAAIKKAHRKLAALLSDYETLDEAIPTVMIMQERPEPKETHVLLRGEYNKPGDKVERGVPASVPPLPKDGPSDRLGLARWMVDPANPLTARVAVNRFWQLYFGTGLVKTTEDFGSQGEWPSHPELLDWLASEFVGSGWNVKHLQKVIVTSAAYRQSSKVRPDVLKKDPENRLLAYAPRVRLPAHFIRDQALFLGGLLVEKVGGPSVKPYQPKGLWEELSGVEYVPDTGEKLYRRSLYVFWKRTIPQPALMTFDAANRESCIVRPARTNTPLQALNLLNDITFVEAARKFAERMMTEGGKTPEERLAFAFRLATARPPREKEQAILLGSFHKYLKRYQADARAALALLSVGEAPRNDKLDVAELAAYTAVANVILNLDETITRQ